MCFITPLHMNTLYIVPPCKSVINLSGIRCYICAWLNLIKPCYWPNVSLSKSCGLQCRIETSVSFTFGKTVTVLVWQKGLQSCYISKRCIILDVKETCTEHHSLPRQQSIEHTFSVAADLKRYLVVFDLSFRNRF